MIMVVCCCYADCLCVCLGVFISRGKEDALVTKNMVVGESVYGEKRISVEVRSLFLYFNLAENFEQKRYSLKQCGALN